jgi:hypothetical protein
MVGDEQDLHAFAGLQIAFVQGYRDAGFACKLCHCGGRQSRIENLVKRLPELVGVHNADMVAGHRVKLVDGSVGCAPGRHRAVAVHGGREPV